MKNSNGRGSIFKTSDKRRKPYVVRAGGVYIDGKLKRKVYRVVFKNDFVRYIWDKYRETNEEKYAIFLILFYTGMRSIDLLRVQNKNINLEERYLITGSKTIAGMNRKVPLHHLIFPLVKKYKNKDINLFNITSTSNLNKIFSRIIQEYDINMKGNLHSIRHTFITKMQQLQIKVSIIKNIVGHEEKNVTDGVYTHWTVKDLRDAVNKLQY
ncbi:site-specific integrase [Streptobacillus felis]|uniref:tyrosine-type recombinase/integrase n=1 Tax=Streptobacillus felis TaxID=1384509 RepID=UPI000830BDE4|nr:site-specific integrase [Streptobacillus felis]